MNERVRTRSTLESLPTYVPGKPAPAEAFKVSSNEGPFAPVNSIREAVIAELDSLNRYPDMAAVELRAMLAAEHGVEPSQILVATGASGILADLVRATVDQGDEVVFAWRSFESYPIVVPTHGGVPVPVPLTEDDEHDLEAMAAAITERTRLVVLCSPNNPTGPVISTEALRSFLMAVPAEVSVALDEAYVEFADPHKRADSAALFDEFANLVRVRTFSKVHGMAGLRLGYAIAHPRLARALATVSLPFGASTLAQAAARAALVEPARGELERRVEFIRSERERVLKAVRALPLPCRIPDAQGNFIYLPLGDATAAFVEFARERGLIIRGYGADGARITIAEEAANDRTIEVLTEYTAEGDVSVIAEAADQADRLNR